MKVRGVKFVKLEERREAWRGSEEGCLVKDSVITEEISEDGRHVGGGPGA